jgi:hypothetical protein
VAAETEAGPWCATCGSPGIALAATISPTSPIGRCRSGQRHGFPDRHVILTTSPEARLSAMRRWHRRKATAQHRRHDQGGNTSPYCNHCNRLGWAYPPADPGT